MPSTIILFAFFLLVTASQSTKQIITNENLNLLNEHSIEIFGNTTDLQLINCSISDISPGAFAHGHDLQVLVITGNYITNLRSGVFDSTLENLQRVVLRSNGIRTVQNGSFDGCRHLEHVDLSGNDIRSFDATWFFDCRKLKKIDVSENRVEGISVEGLKDLGDLLEMVLATNLLKRLDGNLGGIELLDVSNNYLEAIGDEFFVGGRFGVIDLENNKLDCLPESLEGAHVKVLNLKRNLKFRCDCLVRIEKWRKTSEVKVMFPSVICEDTFGGFVVYNGNSTAVIPRVTPELKGIPRGT